MNQELLDQLRDLVDKSPRCPCGGDCATVKFLAEKIMEMQVREVGFSLVCLRCGSPLFFDHTNQFYNCRKCEGWFRYEVGGELLEIDPRPLKVC